MCFRELAHSTEVAGPSGLPPSGDLYDGGCLAKLGANLLLTTTGCSGRAVAPYAPGRGQADRICVQYENRAYEDRCAARHECAASHGYRDAQRPSALNATA